MIQLNEFISPSEGKTIAGRFSIDWAKSFEGIKIPHRKQGCLESKNRFFCSNCVEKCEMNCLNCDI